ncbi:hypothetical protein SISSUDRAFT_1063320 [Sistotremastrum suecicum HHB10207 ss-3]|uniref:DUF6533 domain-containing protein n=1 Tax=Sistotremastrum suecicum HHB10207 ss-3 TaxID=1314776 RepID=A0A166BYK0_9AGAM|nr:hypothetical protein SISSUDRAFT_1063320 [Sistotremastrum suecicum HHB10207 ss-3]
MDNGAVVSFLNIVTVGRSCAVAGLAMSIMDIFQTLPDEVEFYWTGAWSLPRVLYFLVRYSNIIERIWQVCPSHPPPSDREDHHMSDTKVLLTLAFSCWTYFLGQALFDNALVFATEAILIYRINAVYNSKPLLIFILSVYILGGIAALIVNFIAISSVKPRDELIPGVYFCISGANDAFLRRVLWTNWFPITVFESLLVILATIALVQYRKIRATNSTLMTTLLRDSILYYASFLIIGIIDTVVEKLSFANVEAAAALLLPLLSAAGVRLLSHLRAKDEELRNGGRRGKDAPPIALSTVHFAGERVKPHGGIVRQRNIEDETIDVSSMTLEEGLSTVGSSPISAICSDSTVVPGSVEQLPQAGDTQGATSSRPDPGDIA